ncbi:DDE_Tnp_1_7 domain-containing protein, partial [Nephila pilipes]
MEFSSASWNDNKKVLLLSTYVGAELAETLISYDKKLKTNVRASCLRTINEYAQAGDVDLMGSFIGRYRIRIKSSK